jgi:hypothetical protein
LTASANHTSNSISNKAERETPVATYTSSKFHDLAEQRSSHRGRSRSGAAVAATKLMPGAGLLAALLFSLGLWAGIWQAASALAAAWLR